MYKYRINDLLAALPMKDYRRAIKLIPKVLNVSCNTFANYRNIRIDDEQDIPHQKVVVLEKLFGLGAGSLQNFKPEYKSLKQLLEECQD